MKITQLCVTPLCVIPLHTGVQRRQVVARAQGPQYLHRGARAITRFASCDAQEKDPRATLSRATRFTEAQRQRLLLYARKLPPNRLDYNGHPGASLAHKATRSVKIVASGVYSNKTTTRRYTASRFWFPQILPHVICQRGKTTKDSW